MLPSSLSNLTALKSLGVTGPVTGPLPAGNASWPALQSFRVSRSMLSGTIPASLLSSSPGLREFSIAGAQITGAVPDAIYALTSLQAVYVQGTPVSGPAWFLDARAAALTQMQRLGFGGFLQAAACLGPLLSSLCCFLGLTLFQFHACRPPLLYNHTCLTHFAHTKHTHIKHTTRRQHEHDAALLAGA